MKIIKDKDGNLINIGDWDYKIDASLPEDKRVRNRLPEGSTEHDAEVVTGYDGGLYLADDPKRLG